MDCLLTQTNVSSTITSCEYLGYMLSPKGSPWPYKSPKIMPRLAGTPESQRHPVFPRIHTSILVSFLDTLKSHSTYMSYRKGTPGTSLMSAIRPLKHLKRLSPQLPLTHWIPDISNNSRNQCFWLRTRSVLSIMTFEVANCIHCVPLQTFSAPELNYDVHDKELLAIFETFKRWWHYWKALDFRSKRSPITGTCNTSQWPKSSHVSKHNGRIPFRIQPHHSFPFQKTQNQTRRTH